MTSIDDNSKIMEMLDQEILLQRKLMKRDRQHYMEQLGQPDKILMIQLEALDQTQTNIFQGMLNLEENLNYREQLQRKIIKLTQG